jgi:heptosyltransferase II
MNCKNDSLTGKVIDCIVALPALMLAKTACALPESVSMMLGRFLGHALYVLRIRRKTVDNNLRIAFPDMTHDTRKKLIKTICINFGESLLEWLGIRKRISSLDQHITCVGMECLEKGLESGKGVLICSAHFGHWEILATAIARFSGKPLTIIRNQWNNSYLDAWFTKIHNAQGFDDMYRLNSGVKLFRALKRNELVGMLVDQNGRRAGIWLPFFKTPSSFHRGPGIVASKTGCAVVTAFCFPGKNNRWEIHFSAVDSVLTGNLEEDTKIVMSAFAERLESAIRKHPDQYFWFHRRWKTKEPEHIRETLSEQCRKVVPENSAVLIRIPNWVGDAVMSTAAITAIKSCRPDLKLYALAKPRVVDVIKNNPDFSGIIVYNPGRLPRRILDFFKIVNIIRSQSFDAYVLLHKNFESALIGYSARIPIRIGWKNKNIDRFLSHKLKMTQTIRNSHQVHQYLSIADYVAGKRSTDVIPVLHLTEKDKTIAENWLNNLPKTGPVIPIGASAAYGSAKCWPPERFAEFVDLAVERWNAKIVFSGGEKDEPVHELIQSLTQHRTYSMVGKHSLTVQAAVIEKAGICIANDSGLTHVSAALKDVRTVVIFGPTIPAATQPFGNSHIVLHKKVGCWPCKHRQCPSNHDCMTAISAEDVLDAVETILSNR